MQFLNILTLLFQGHMCNVLRARIQDNRTVIGYIEWTMMDNFEWEYGYT